MEKEKLNSFFYRDPVVHHYVSQWPTLIRNASSPFLRLSLLLFFAVFFGVQILFPALRPL